VTVCRPEVFVSTSVFAPVVFFDVTDGATETDSLPDELKKAKAPSATSRRTTPPIIKGKNFLIGLPAEAILGLPFPSSFFPDGSSFFTAPGAVGERGLAPPGTAGIGGFGNPPAGLGAGGNAGLGGPEDAGAFGGAAGIGGFGKPGGFGAGAGAADILGGGVILFDAAGGCGFGSGMSGIIREKMSK
jgi:hypothetical protein